MHCCCSPGPLAYLLAQRRRVRCTVTLTTLEVSDEVLAHARKVGDRGTAARMEWTAGFDAWVAREPDRKALLDRMLGRTLPDGWENALPSWGVDPQGIATRKASGEVLTALADVLPELWGDSADLAESNNTTMEGADSFGPASTTTTMWEAHPYGRTLHFGVREHAMGAILSGIALHGPTAPTAAPSSCSATTCAARSDWRR